MKFWDKWDSFQWGEHAIEVFTEKLSLAAVESVFQQCSLWSSLTHLEQINVSQSSQVISTGIESCFYTLRRALVEFPKDKFLPFQPFLCWLAVQGDGMPGYNFKTCLLFFVPLEIFSLIWRRYRWIFLPLLGLGFCNMSHQLWHRKFLRPYPFISMVDRLIAWHFTPYLRLLIKNIANDVLKFTMSCLQHCDNEYRLLLETQSELLV